MDQTAADARYVNVTGDRMTGTLTQEAGNAYRIMQPGTSPEAGAQLAVWAAGALIQTYRLGDPVTTITAFKTDPGLNIIRLGTESVGEPSQQIRIIGSPIQVVTQDNQPFMPIWPDHVVSKKYADQQDLLKVGKAGDTVSGLLTIGSTGQLVVDKTVLDLNSDGSWYPLRFRLNGVTRWEFGVGGGGARLDLDRLNSSGAYLDTPLSIEHTTGLIAVTADPTSSLGVATKQYVDKSMPIGAIIAYGGTAAPTGWHLCNGTAHGSSALQAVIGSTSTPDLRDRFIVAAGSSYAQGATGGATSHVHGSSTLKSELTIATAGQTYMNRITTPNWTASMQSTGATAVPQTTSTFVSNSGVNVSGNTDSGDNRPPYYALTYIIKKA